jgi:hypothetical protein
VEPRYYLKVIPKLFAAKRTFVGFSINKSWMKPLKLNQCNLNIRFYSTSGHLVNARRGRGIFTPSRSEVKVVSNSIENAVIVYKLKACEVLQSNMDFARATITALKLFMVYNKRIDKASKIVKNTFTLFNITAAYFNYYWLCNISDNYTKGVGALNLPLYQNLCDPCFLLIVFSSLKNSKTAGVDDVPLENVTLAAIISLSKELQSLKYSPKPTKRVFILKVNGTMRPLGIASSKDKIVQQALKIVLG